MNTLAQRGQRGFTLVEAIAVILITGIVGAFVGGWGFRELGLHSPLDGLAGVILVAFLGAVALLLVLGLLRRNRRD